MVLPIIMATPSALHLVPSTAAFGCWWPPTGVRFARVASNLR